MRQRRLALTGCALAVVGSTMWTAAAFATDPSYETCNDAPHALRREDPGYRPGLDANNDGVACEEKGAPGTTVKPPGTAGTTVPGATTTVAPTTSVPPLRANPKFTG